MSGRGITPRTAATAALSGPGMAPGAGVPPAPRKRVQYTITTLTGDLPGAELVRVPPARLHPHALFQFPRPCRPELDVANRVLCTFCPRVLFGCYPIICCVKECNFSTEPLKIVVTFISLSAALLRLNKSLALLLS